MTTEYFSKFPKITYNGKSIKDITIRLDFFNRIKENISIYQYIQISHGQRPEDIAYLYYDDPTLYWIVLYVNNIIDPWHDWLLTEDQLYKYAVSKYDDIYSMHHYETTEESELGEGIIVDSLASFKTTVTNLSYEQSKNELKRKIKILKPEYIRQIISEYKKAL